MALALTDDELSAIWSAARPLPPPARAGFLEAVAEIARTRGGLPEGGELFRMLRDLQRAHFRPPQGTQPGRVAPFRRTAV